MKTYLVSLERLPERRARTEAALRSLGIDYEIFAAIDGSKGEHERFAQYDEAKCLNNFGVPLRPGEIGCFASHYTLWQRCVAGSEPIAIIEEDATILPGFDRALALAAERVGQHRFIRLAGLVPRDYSLIEEIDATHRLVRLYRGPQGTQCYCISPEGAAALLKFSTYWVEPVDLFVDRFWLHGVDAIALLPFATEHEKGNSTIRGRRQKRSGAAKLRREVRRFGDAIARRLYNLRHP